MDTLIKSKVSNRIVIGAISLTIVVSAVAVGYAYMVSRALPAVTIDTIQPQPDGLTWVKEAEKFTLSNGITVQDGYFIRMSGRDGIPNLNTKITSENLTLTPGDYNLFVRVIADATNRDSFMYKLPGSNKFLVHQPTRAVGWQWTKIPFTITDSVVDYPLEIAWRETKDFDLVIISKNPNFDPTSKLIGYWNFDSKEYPTADISGYENQPTVSSCRFDVGIIGSACLYGGSNSSYSKINSVAKFINPKSGTITAWAYPIKNAYNTYVIEGMGYDSDRYYIQWTDNKFRVVRGNPGVAIVLAPQTDLGKWYHLALSWDEKNVYGYLNGELINSAEYTPKEIPPTRFNIGTQDQYNPAKYFSGIIDEVRFYNSKLSDSEIKEIYTKDVANADHL